MAMGLHKCRLIRDTHTSKEKHIDVVRFAYILSNCDIDFFVFCHLFQNMIPKFLKFKRVQNSAGKFQIDRKQN